MEVIFIVSFCSSSSDYFYPFSLSKELEHKSVKVKKKYSWDFDWKYIKILSYFGKNEIVILYLSAHEYSMLLHLLRSSFVIQ